MLSPRLSECTECSSISQLLDIIDCKLTELAKNEYNNIIFSLNLPIQSETFGDLLNYKRILTNKLCNYDYACAFSLSAIASRVKVLTGGLTNCCVRKKAKPSHYIPIVPTTTTTSSSTTSTSTTSTSTTTTTTTLSPDQLCVVDWSKSNLSVTTYANGDPIPEVTNTVAWANLTTGAWCYYNNDPANEPIYGRLYNWYAVNDVRGLAPSGYRVSTSTDWTTLKDCVDNSAAKLKSVTGWAAGTAPTGTNTTGFTALPGGLRSGIGLFTSVGGNGYWWNSDTVSGNSMGVNFNGINSPSSVSNGGFSVRIVLI